MVQVLGIDIGGSGIKGAPVDINTGEMLAERYRIETPLPSTPKAVAKAVTLIKEHFDWHAPIGCGYPGVVRNGITLTASNVDKDWLGADALSIFSKYINDSSCPVALLNDADAAGIAEMRFGAGRGRKGVVLILTIGTGIGTALFTDGYLVPNLELGHLEINCREAEPWISDATRKSEDLSWKKWAARFNVYLEHIEKYLWPELIILGGGGSKKADKFMEYLTVKAEILPAQMLNNAGIIGAALAAENLCAK
jgi:polyphosphate glucokinase